MVMFYTKNDYLALIERAIKRNREELAKVITARSEGKLSQASTGLLLESLKSNHNLLETVREGLQKMNIDKIERGEDVSAITRMAEVLETGGHFALNDYPTLAQNFDFL